jgi:hypothetical protein
MSIVTLTRLKGSLMGDCELAVLWSFGSLDHNMRLPRNHLSESYQRLARPVAMRFLAQTGDACPAIIATHQFRSNYAGASTLDLMGISQIQDYHFMP